MCWSASLLFNCTNSRFSNNKAHVVLEQFDLGLKCLYRCIVLVQNHRINYINHFIMRVIITVILDICGVTFDAKMYRLYEPYQAKKCLRDNRQLSNAHAQLL